MAETDFQRKPLWYANDVLARRYRDRDDVYVSANLFVYYEEGNPSAVVAPDVFVVLGASSHDRRSYKLWEEPKAPDFVLEITSRSTQGADGGSKRRVYARLGVREYWRYDPTGDYLDPPLRGERLAGGRYVRLPLVTRGEGSVVGRSEVLGLDVAVVGGRLRLREPGDGSGPAGLRGAGGTGHGDGAVRRAGGEGSRGGGGPPRHAGGANAGAPGELAQSARPERGVLNTPYPSRPGSGPVGLQGGCSMTGASRFAVELRTVRAEPLGFDACPS